MVNIPKLWHSDKNGNGSTKALPLGKYNVQEINTSVTAESGMTYNLIKFIRLKLTHKIKTTTAIVTSATATENVAVTGQALFWNQV